ncbi:PTS galactosamine/N-acetylgalactosamine transporter subunit IIA [Thermoanaerobacter sp. CM-CNRG TB177]|jgi:mannose/fructose/sorbose-specific phosphotransferase system IIA component|uniref:PTS galactosamine/N-acetylgalactosamine transporter subunit IIA n=1 Tax=Thermoanaerobacter sp. CM-CNRG TB177 TaxID=2800659 RepID=UPI001BDE68A1|nr:PTS galactosamine/N-acetylgalactosamine transporter subunit IIA [Thermoanaerobacter sp. CM-CNRG TB177]MBT1279144.1 PTS sugar transporter subunit IIA [Thermoanaerobacter sp. CM-CNRG TB177]
MVRLIITGHGKFARGLIDGIEIIVGKQENLIGIEFNNQDLEIYTAQIENAIKEAKDKNESVVILTDLIGGTPFRVCSFVSRNYSDVYVITGANIPMLIEAVLSRENFEVNEFVNYLINVGKNGIESLDNLLERKKKANAES